MEEVHFKGRIREKFAVETLQKEESLWLGMGSVVTKQLAELPPKGLEKVAVMETQSLTPNIAGYTDSGFGLESD